MSFCLDGTVPPVFLCNRTKPPHSGEIDPKHGVSRFSLERWSSSAHTLTLKKIGASDISLAPIWRRERDSNPRTGISRYTISNRAPSTSSAISPNGCCPWSLVTAKIIIPDFFPPSSFFQKNFRFFCRPGNGPLREAVSAAPFCQIARKRGLLFPLFFHGEN